MNERSLSRRLATSIVETLRAQGHILLVKGGSESLVRELDVLMAPQIAAIAPLLSPRALLVDEVTSTFGTEAVDETVEEMVGKVTTTLMDSDHVEDVFAEDNVIRRDIFRVVRDTLLGAPIEEEVEEEPAAVSVRLDTLGYVAKAVAKRADVETLRDALERAAEAAGADLGGYDANTREATFALQSGEPDQRLEIEEAVADELADLVDVGLVDLPTIERRVELPREVLATERPTLRPRIDVAATKTLMRSGCAATWEFAGPAALKITFTPMSDKDARDVDEYMTVFDREAVSIVGAARPPSAPEPREATVRAPAPAPAPEPAEPASKKTTRIVRAARAKPATTRAAPKKEPAAPAAAPVGKKPAAKRATKASTKQATLAAKPRKTAKKKA